MSEEMISRVYQAELDELWNILEVYAEESKELNNIRNTIKEGINLKIHINYILTPNRGVIDKSNIGAIEILRRRGPITQFWDEINERKKLARKALVKHFSKPKKNYESA